MEVVWEVCTIPTNVLIVCSFAYTRESHMKRPSIWPRNKRHASITTSHLISADLLRK